MLLFQKRFYADVVSGAITLTFRRWQRPQVSAGGRYRCHPIGVLLVRSVEPERVSQIQPEDARAAGFEDVAALLEYLGSARPEPLEPDTVVFRVEFAYVGDEDARPAAFDARVPEDELRSLEDRLSAMDRSSATGPWTWQTLELIEAHPRRRAGDLAEMLGRERLNFKKDVRRLKALGLTISHEVGYTISPRGRSLLRHRRRE